MSPEASSSTTESSSSSSSMITKSVSLTAGLRSGTAITGSTGKRQHPQFDPNWDIWQKIEAEQTGRVIGPKKDRNVDRPVRFLNHKQLEEGDSFSASWLQKRDSFMTMALDDIGICEDAAFFAYMKEDRINTMRMTADWLDFAVEHLSKWYNMLDIMENDIPLNNAIEKLEKYMERGYNYPVGKEPFLKDTIAVISFQAFQPENDGQKDKAIRITIPTLAATIESLRRAGFGRVVVCGVEATDAKLAKDAFALLHKLLKDPSDVPPGGVKNIGPTGMEVEFARGHMGHATTTHHTMNIPRSTLMGLREAFRIHQRGDNDHDSIVNMRTWLGDHPLNHWKYVYLTEPDSILATRPSTLKTIQRYVEGGTVLIPWRLQPIPHESDVRGCQKQRLYLKDEGDFQKILELDSLDEKLPDKCCDEFKGDYRPGLPPHFEDCGNFWYICGFMKRVIDKETPERANDRLKPYPLIRLKHGTQLVHLSAQEHGRRCKPVQSENNDVCAPPSEQR